MYLYKLLLLQLLSTFFLSAFSLTYQGCFRDDISNRDFIQSTKWIDTEKMTKERCAFLCFRYLGHQYMGLQVSFVSTK